MNEFAKGHALGNDYVVVDAGQLGFTLTPRAIRRICDRHTGVGSDGILTWVPSQRADFGLRIYNPDASEAEKSGNGLRIFARYLADHGHVRGDAFTVETPGGVVTVTLHRRNGELDLITVAMGRAAFDSESIPAAGPPRDVVGEAIEVDGTPLTITALSVGNPHCVVFSGDLERADFSRLGPALERHPLFPERTNVQFAHVVDRGRIRIRIWERGVGETMASGSSACAVAAAAVRHGLVDRDVEVVMDGGMLRIQVSEDYGVVMTGPADEVYTGRLSDRFVRSLEE